MTTVGERKVASPEARRDFRAVMIALAASVAGVEPGTLEFSPMQTMMRVAPWRHVASLSGLSKVPSVTPVEGHDSSQGCSL